MDKQDAVLHIRGMHCPSCPLLVEESLSSLAGFCDVQASLAKHTCAFQYDSTLYPTEEALKQAINTALAPHGFSVQEKGQGPLQPGFFSARNMVEMFVGLGLAFFVWQMLVYFEDNMSFGEAEGLLMPLTLGFAASLSCCVAVTGSLIIGFTASYGKGKSKAGLMAMNTSLQAGRLLGFFVFGGLLGLVGTSLALSGHTLSVLYVLIALLLVSLAIPMLDLPFFALLPFRLPSSMGVIQKLGKTQKSFVLPFLVGVLTFFIPCGFAISMMLLALQTHSFFQGGLTMLFFALGTLPVLFLVGFTASLTSHKGFGLLRKAMAFLLLFFAFSTFQSASVYWGFSGNVLGMLQPSVAHAWPWSSEPEEPAKSPLLPQAAAPVVQGASDSIIEMHVKGRTFSPATLYAKAGEEVTWHIVGERVSPCANRIIIPSLNISLPVKNGLNTITFTMPDNPGPLQFSCWMGMEKGVFLVQSPKD